MSHDSPFTREDSNEPRYNRDRAEVFARLGAGWHPVPNLFAVLHEIENQWGANDKDETRRVPASFHKYLQILWREIFFDRGPEKPDWTAEMYDDQFNMRPNDAGKWKWALAESGLFKVRQIAHVKKLAAWGARENIGNIGPLSVYTYNIDATRADWMLFYKALRAACAECPRHYKVSDWRAVLRRHMHSENAGVTEADNAGVFQ
jgi:hypothetical protein